MRTEKLDYYLPPELIAQKPTDIRSDSKLLVFNLASGELVDSRFSQLGNFLLPGDCLILNDTKVLPARFFGQRIRGEKLEGLFLAETEAGIWEVLLKGARKIKPGETIYLKDKQVGQTQLCRATFLGTTGQGTYHLKIETGESPETILDKIGFPPLPPYIKRGDDLAEAAIDKLRYQTVYASKTGAIAAPTAGLHFTNELVEHLKAMGICFAHLTLHIGIGTFKPIVAENLEEHKMQQERFSLNEENSRIINMTKEKGGRIIAVGTTSVRTLETIASGSQVKAAGGTTELFIKPGYKFKMVDAMVTNFHLPKSTLLALVAAFAGLENILAAYRHAISQQYRFYSYGDAMLIV